MHLVLGLELDLGLGLKFVLMDFVVLFVLGSRIALGLSHFARSTNTLTA